MNPDPFSILGLASSEPEYSSNSTGVGGARHFLFKELASRYELTEVFQPKPSGLTALASRIATWVPNREIAQRTYKRHRWIFQEKSRACESYINALQSKPSLIFQWEFFFSPYASERITVPYVVYNDWTTRLSAREFPEWALPRVRKHVDRLQGELMRRAACVFTFSEKVRRSVIYDYGIPAEKVVTAFAGVNINHFPDPIRRPDRDRVTILFGGNDYARKGLGTLLKAFRVLRAELPSVELIVFGDPGPNYVALEEPRVRHLGHVSDKGKISELYATADIFVLPTKTEAFGHVYAEAMAHSLPCIGTKVGAVNEVILEEETGFLIESGDSVGLTERLRKLVTSREMRIGMGQQGYNRANKHFRWDKVVDVMTPYLHQAAAGRI
ncbi:MULTISPECIES: glycosyltransferase family 4 protein [Rhizobium]|uniref:Glycosyltransferase family 4 protein n=1 Tax=Rhizobium aouanii TaxID=3118145 RepID=A0ABU8CJL5_9HYPH|nr:glycosyltransferase family 4 protein [Rhizobium acaciae]MCW1410815.1 glycosyltransferase family 4 protein [Rhizobium acaciae]MCW1742886.1 glycosyltransferase family 4 protein [Rhizobium acaciae]MCW1750082.1 glycosyltransferase family 4 protein [Rhizobium acaciae]